MDRIAGGREETGFHAGAAGPWPPFSGQRPDHGVPELSERSDGPGGPIAQTGSDGGRSGEAGGPHFAQAGLSRNPERGRRSSRNAQDVSVDGRKPAKVNL